MLDSDDLGAYLGGNFEEAIVENQMPEVGGVEECPNVQFEIVGQAPKPSYFAAGAKAGDNKERPAAIIHLVDLIGGKVDGLEKECEENEKEQQRQRKQKQQLGGARHQQQQQQVMSSRLPQHSPRSATVKTFEQFRKSSPKSPARAAVGSLLSCDRVVRPLRALLMRAYMFEPQRFSPSLGRLISELIEEEQTSGGTLNTTNGRSSSGNVSVDVNNGNANCFEVDMLEKEMASIFGSCSLWGVLNDEINEEFGQTIERLVENGGNRNQRQTADKPSPKKVGLRTAVDMRPISVRGGRAVPVVAVNGITAPRNSPMPLHRPISPVMAGDRSSHSASLQWRTLNDFYKDHEEIFSPNGGEYSFAVAGLKLPVAGTLSKAATNSPAGSTSKPAQSASKLAQSASRLAQSASKPVQIASKPAQSASKPAQSAPLPPRSSPSLSVQKSKLKKAKKKKKKTSLAKYKANLSRLLRPTASSLASEYRNNYGS